MDSIVWNKIKIPSEIGLVEERKIMSSSSSIPVATVVSADHREVHVVGVPGQRPGVPVVLTVQAERPICRRCGREFVRPPGVHDAMAQYYRCGPCIQPRVEDFFGCIVS